MDEKWYYVLGTALLVSTLGAALGVMSRPIPIETGPYRVAVIELWDVSNGTYMFSKVLENPKNFTLALSYSVEPNANLTYDFDSLGPLEHKEVSFTLTVIDPIPKNYVINVEGDKA